MKVDLTAEDLVAIEDALLDCLVYDNEGDRDSQCVALVKVRNALGRTPASTPESVRAWVDNLRAQVESTGSFSLDS